LRKKIYYKEKAKATESGNFPQYIGKAVEARSYRKYIWEKKKAGSNEAKRATLA